MLIINGVVVPRSVEKSDAITLEEWLDMSQDERRDWLEGAAVDPPADEEEAAEESALDNADTDGGEDDE